MIPESQIVPFFTLPYELRMHIYQNLLSPDPKTVHLLYHDRKGRNNALNLHPAILRTNKQIYQEASPILYEKNKFYIDLSTRVVQQCQRGRFYPDDAPHPVSLIRDDSHPPELPQGLIYSDCLKKLRYLELETADDAILGLARRGYYLSHTFKLVCKLLAILADEEHPKSPGSGMKVLKFALYIRRGKPPRLNLSGNHEEQRRILELLEAVKSRRNVMISTLRLD